MCVKKNLHKKIKDLHLIVHPTKPLWTFVNDFGWEIIKKLEDQKSFSELIQDLSSQFTIEKDIIENDIHDFIKSFERLGFIDDSICQNARTEESFSVLYLNVTNRCNLHCTHCSYPQMLNEGLAELTEYEILNFLDDFYSAGGTTVNISGGEPLIRKDLIRKILIKNTSIKKTVLTNGILIDDDFALCALESNAIVQVSIDGSHEDLHDSIRGKGAFKKTLKGIQTLQKNGLADNIVLCATILQKNIKDLKNIITFAHDNNIHSVRFMPLRKEGRACDNWSVINCEIMDTECDNFYTSIFERAREDYPDMNISSGLCGFVLNKKDLNEHNYWCPIEHYLVVGAFGDVYSCPNMMVNEHRLGNIRVNKIAYFLKSPLRLGILDALKNRKNSIEECSVCLWKNFCQGGCMGLALHSAGSLWQHDELCYYRKKLYEKAMLLIAEGNDLKQRAHRRSECT